MFKKDLKDKYSFLTDYFEQGIKNPNRAIAHSILFYGHDIKTQYEFASQIAKLLNCKESQNENCRCINCNWINDSQHPAVLTISKLDNKPSDDTSKTVISIKQSQMVKNSLMNTSEYHRVFIFCDAKIEKLDGESKWIPMGLNQTNFQAETANSLLKIIEEPPENTTFFFLTRDKNDLLETIISRSQCFFVPSCSSDVRTYSTVQEVFADYPQIERKNVFDFAQQLFGLSKEHGTDKILGEAQNFLHALLKSNLEDKALQSKIINDLKLIEQAHLMINNHINPQLAFEDMCLKLTENSL